MCVLHPEYASEFLFPMNIFEINLSWSCRMMFIMTTWSFIQWHFFWLRFVRQNFVCCTFCLATIRWTLRSCLMCHMIEDFNFILLRGITSYKTTGNVNTGVPQHTIIIISFIPIRLLYSLCCSIQSYNMLQTGNIIRFHIFSPNLL